MKKTLVTLAAVVALALSGCSSTSDPIRLPPDTPMPTKSASAITTEPTTPDAEPTTKEPSDPKTTEPVVEKPQPTVAPTTTSDASTPGNKLVSRWAPKYPNVPEFAILKAANATCRAIEAGGDNWSKNPVALLAIEGAATAAGLSDNDALEFAQDANQNYCSSVANPT